ncbi:hypothetical protein LguiA_005737 [Lonicera macranthoides]
MTFYGISYSVESSRVYKAATMLRRTDTDHDKKLQNPNSILSHEIRNGRSSAPLTAIPTLVDPTTTAAGGVIYSAYWHRLRDKNRQKIAKTDLSSLKTNRSYPKTDRSTYTVYKFSCSEVHTACGGEFKLYAREKRGKEECGVGSR